MKKAGVKFFVAGFSVLSSLAMAANFDSALTQEQVDHRIDFLEQQIADLKNQVQDLKIQNSHVTAEPTEGSLDYLKKSEILENEDITLAVQAHSMVSFGSYLNINPTFDGSELIVNTSSIREPMRLLKRNYQTQQDAIKANKPLPRIPRLELSGNLGVQASYARNYNAHSGSTVDLTDVELDVYAAMNTWITGYIAYVYDNDIDESSVKREDNSRLLINKAFVTLGDFSKTPFYGTIGQYYVPFGRYSSLMITAPLTQSVGRTKERALEVGYKTMSPNAPYAEMYIFASSSGFGSERRTINDGGMDIGYEFTINDKISGEIGTSVISTIADSNGIQGGGSGTGFTGLNDSSATETLSRRVPGANVYTSLNFSPFTFIAEYLTATHEFDTGSGFLYGAGRGAKPAAFNSELIYTFDWLNKPHSIALGYGHTSEAVALGLPNRRYIATYNVTIWQHTLESLEFRREYNYSASAGRYMDRDKDSAFANLGHFNNIITAKMNVYF